MEFADCSPHVSTTNPVELANDCCIQMGVLSHLQPARNVLVVSGQFQLDGHTQKASTSRVLCHHLNDLPILLVNTLGHPMVALFPILSHDVSAGEENLQFQITEVTEIKDTETKEIR